jgi:hypothetical protein
MHVVLFQLRVLLKRHCPSQCMTLLLADLGLRM